MPEKYKEEEKMGKGEEEKEPEAQDIAKDSTTDGPTAPGPTAEGSSADESVDIAPHPYEEILDDYALRDPSEDPVWSVRIVKWWMWFLAFSVGGIVLLLILGFFYD
jgi:archaellum component FlaD/FlaE